MNQFFVEREDGDREMPPYWMVIKRDGLGKEDVEAVMYDGTEAVRECARLNGLEMARKAEIDAAYEAGYRRPAVAGRVTREAVGLMAAAREAGINVQPMRGGPLGLGTKPNR